MERKDRQRRRAKSIAKTAQEAVILPNKTSSISSGSTAGSSDSRVSPKTKTKRPSRQASATVPAVQEVVELEKAAASRKSSRRRSSAPRSVEAVVGVASQAPSMTGKGEYESRQYRRESRSRGGGWEVLRKGSYAYWPPRRLSS